MTSDDWKQIEALYHSALEVGGDERADFLAVACAGDETLRREVFSLLRSAERAGSFLEEPVRRLGLRLMRETPRTRRNSTAPPDEPDSSTTRDKRALEGETSPAHVHRRAGRRTERLRGGDV